MVTILLPTQNNTSVVTKHHLGEVFLIIFLRQYF